MKFKLYEVINIKKFGDFFKRIRLNEEKKSEGNTEPKEERYDIQIQIEGDINLFIDEKEKIIEGAKQLLQMGKADNMEEAIINFAVMFRGLKFSKIKKTDEGTTVVVLKETAQDTTVNIYGNNEIGDR